MYNFFDESTFTCTLHGVPIQTSHLKSHISHLTSHISPFTFHHSPFTIHYSQFTIHYSQFTIHHLLFTIYYLLFTIYLIISQTLNRIDKCRFNGLKTNSNHSYNNQNASTQNKDPPWELDTIGIIIQPIITKIHGQRACN